jgi:hypothetical protein
MMNRFSPPFISCAKVRLSSIDDWGDVERALIVTPPCHLQQAWRTEPEPEFRAAMVHVGWTDDALIVHAKLEDDDIFNPVTEFNAPAFERGDVFEIFLRATTQDAYYEFHISPTNQKFQLRLPAEGVVRRQPIEESIGKFLFDRRRIDSRVKILLRHWVVLAAIPLDVVQETGAVGPDTRWRFSFCRYDYTRGKAQPVLSSTSPHRQLDFHRQQEWGELTFI